MLIRGRKEWRGELRVVYGHNYGSRNEQGVCRGLRGSLGQRGRLWREVLECKRGIKSSKGRVTLEQVDFRQEQSGKCKLILRPQGNTRSI